MRALTASPADCRSLAIFYDLDQLEFILSPCTDLTCSILFNSFMRYSRENAGSALSLSRSPFDVIFKSEVMKLRTEEDGMTVTFESLALLSIISEIL